MMRRLRSLAVGAGLVLALGVGSYCNAVNTHGDAVSRLEDSSRRLTNVTQTLSAVTSSAQTLLDETDASDVADEAVLSDLEEALSQASVALEATPSEHVCSTIFDAPAIEAVIEANAEGQSAAAEAVATVHSAIEAVEDSVSLKKAQDAYDALQASRDEAQSLLDETEDEVEDDGTRDELSDAIAAADEALAVEPDVGGAEAYEKAEEALATASEAVTSSHEEWEEAQEAAAAAAAAARAASSSSSSSSSGGSSSSSGGSSSSSGGSSSSSSSTSSAWTVSYVAYTQSNLDAGYVCEWKSGYYVAHNWSSGGIRIASKPTYVVVNGVTYKYVSSQLVSPGTTWGQVKDFVLANSGIGFQTCSGNYYLITHYEPV